MMALRQLVTLLPLFSLTASLSLPWHLGSATARLLRRGSSTAACNDHTISFPIADVQGANLKLDMQGAGGGKCCVTPNLVEASAVCAYSGKVQIQIHSLDLAKSINGPPKSGDLTSSGGKTATTDPQNDGTQPLCIDDAALANYVADWASKDFNAPCITGDNVYNMSQNIWQVPGLVVTM